MLALGESVLGLGFFDFFEWDARHGWMIRRGRVCQRLERRSALLELSVKLTDVNGRIVGWGKSLEVVGG